MSTVSNTSQSIGLEQLNSLDSLTTLVTSFVTVNGWIHLVVIGGALEGVRRVASAIWERILTAFFLTASFDENEACHDWLETWLMKQPSWSKPRTLDVFMKKRGDLGFSAFDDHEVAARSGPEHVQYQPSMGQTTRLWYKGSLIWVMRASFEEQDTGGYKFKTRSICITMISRYHEKLARLLQEAHAAYKAEVENRINIRSSYDQYRGWSSSVSRPKRPLSSVVLPSSIKQRVLSDAREFLSSEKWYAERGIPWRRGYLLHGSPGTGKTSLIYAIAGELDLDIYVFSLAKRGMDDDELMNVINSLPSHSIALMEDIDAAFTRGISRGAVAGDVNDPATGAHGGPPHSAPGVPPPPPPQGITLAGLLAAIDGVAAQEGRILFATTNDRAALDLALCRPGRLDVHFEFRLANREQAEELFEHFYPIGQDYDDISIKPQVDITPEELIDVSDPNDGEKGVTTTDLDEEELTQLAKEFAALIPEEEFSMAALQGHLMQFKKCPREAVQDTPDWIIRERAAKREWEEARRRRMNPPPPPHPLPQAESLTVSNVEPTTNTTNSPIGGSSADL